VEPQSFGGPEDDVLLQVARKLCDKLGLKASSVDRLLWRDFLHDVRTSRKVRVRCYGGHSFGHMLSAHFPILFDRALVLREMMKGRLQQEDWEPLFCSSLIFYGQFRWGRYLRRSLALLPFFASFAFIISSWIMYRYLGYPLPPWQVSAILLVALLISPFFPGLYLIRRLDRHSVLMADQRTAMVLGKERLLQTLEKIEAMRQSDLDQGKHDDWRDFMFVPKATERIKNLQK